MNAEVFKVSINKFRDKLYRLAYSIVRDEMEAHDVVQDSLIKVWKSMKNNHVNNLEAWSMRITKNTALDIVNSARVRRTEGLNQMYEKSDSGLHSPYMVTEMNDMMSNVHSIIDKLPEKQQLVIKLRDIEGYPYQDISEMLELSLSDTKITLFRARKKIREELNKIEDFEIR